MAFINWLHVFGVAPLLTYIVIENSQGRVLKDEMLTFLTILIFVLILFHFYRGMKG